jgi:hypothetical protein|tara:strand:+ start:502 stop:1077 length:576 start_codon:yes stop_codon:yes gene_type:complete
MIARLFSIIFVFFSFSLIAQAGITTCQGKYALCAASTCQPTGKTITTSNGNIYPEVICKCPIIDGQSIADTTMGNMQGSCDPTDDKHIWSLFAPKKYYPQEASNFSKRPERMEAVVQKCDASLNQGFNASNCFSFNCKIGPNNIAICRCPMGQAPAATTFLTEAGQGNPEACYQHPVSLPVQQTIESEKGR